MKNKTIKPGKQRKRMLTGVYHIKRKLLVAPLDKALEKQVNRKRVSLRKGDTVKVLVGSNKGKTSTVERVNYDKGVVYLKDFKVTNSRGQEKLLPFQASNLIITNLVLTDKKRLIVKKPKKQNI
jgi:large subunit ribosomal protein L24